MQKLRAGINRADHQARKRSPVRAAWLTLSYNCVTSSTVSPVYSAITSGGMSAAFSFLAISFCAFAAPSSYACAAFSFT